MGKLKEISEETLIPLSLLITIVGGVFWLSSVNSKAQTAADMATECSQDFKKIDERLSRIEGKLGIER